MNTNTTRQARNLFNAIQGAHAAANAVHLQQFAKLARARVRRERDAGNTDGARAFMDLAWLADACAESVGLPAVFDGDRIALKVDRARRWI